VCDSSRKNETAAERYILLLLREIEIFDFEGK
jgi:hypothetical protein